VLQGLQAKAKELEKEQEQAAAHLKEAEAWISDLEERQQELSNNIVELEQEKALADARVAAKEAEEDINKKEEQRAKPGGWSQEDWGIENPTPASMLAALRYLSANWAGVTNDDGELLQAVNKVLDKQEASTQALGATSLKGKGKSRRASPGESDSEHEGGDEGRTRTRSPRSRWGNNN